MRTHRLCVQGIYVIFCQFAAKSLRFSSRIPAIALLEEPEFEARLAEFGRGCVLFVMRVWRNWQTHQI